LYSSDPRPINNARANSLKGGGYEGKLYTNCHVEFAGVENIHVMRKDLKKLFKLVDGG
jgi:hypothetical protein